MAAHRSEARGEPRDRRRHVSEPVPLPAVGRWKKQVDWESAALAYADIVLFWIPNQVETVEGRDYAQTTRMELLESLALGRKVILGIDTDIRAADYMRYKARRYGVRHIHKTLEGCLKELRSVGLEEAKSLSSQA